MSRRSEQVARVFQQALELSDDDRALLVTELVATLPGPTDQDDADLSPSQRAELQKRCDELSAGAVKAVPWQQARTQIDARLQAVRNQRGR